MMMGHGNGSRRASFSSSSGELTHDERNYQYGYPSSSYDEFAYYQEMEQDDNHYYDYNYGSSGFGRQVASSGMYGDLTRATSSDSVEYSMHPGHDMRGMGPGIQNPFAYSQAKCRQLPCRTFISTGSCPYGDRCVFLHDPSIVSKPIYIRSKRKSKDDTGVDAFFWPTMPWNAVMGKTDMKNMPLIAQPYIVPAPNSYSTSTSNNDVAVYSMWEHFLDFCKEDPLSVVTVPRKVPPLNPFAVNNPYTGRRRLPVFVQLSQYTPFTYFG